MMKNFPGYTPQDSPDIIDRVFRLKLDQLLNDIKKEQYFGVCIGGETLFLLLDLFYICHTLG